MANPALISDWTTILNEGSTSATATLPTIPSGSNRMVLVGFAMYNGSSTCTVPTTVSANGVAAQLVIAAPAAQNRLAVGVYAFFEADIPLITGQVLTSTGGAGTQKSILIQVLGDAQQAVPANKSIGYATTAQTITIPLTRLAESFTTTFAFCSQTASNLSTTNPARTLNTSLTSDRRVPSGTQNDTSGTSDFVVAGAAYTNALAINVPVAGVHSIGDVNDGRAVIPGQSFTWSPTFTPTSGTIGGLPLSGVSLSGATAPGYVDGGPILLPGTRTVTAIDGSITASASAPVGVIPGYTYVVLAPGFNTGNYSVVQNAGASAGWVVIHPDTDVVGTDALLKTNVEGSRTYWLCDPVSGLGYSYLVTTGVGDDGNEFVRVRRQRGDPVEFKKVFARKVTGIKP